MKQQTEDLSTRFGIFQRVIIEGKRSIQLFQDKDIVLKTFLSRLDFVLRPFPFLDGYAVTSIWGINACTAVIRNRDIVRDNLLRRSFICARRKKTKRGVLAKI
jgi:hypothetical protein